MKFNQIAFALMATFGVIGSVHAAVGAGQSYTESGGVRVGSSTSIVYLPLGQAGIGVNGTFPLTGALVPASHFADDPDYLDGNDVLRFSGKELVNDYGAPSTWPIDHSGLGVWAFKQIGTQDVYFGEWNKEGTTQGSKVANTHTVFYVGSNTSSTPTSGTATYSIEGINNYNRNTASAQYNLLSGSLNVTYGSGTTGKFSGSLTGGTADTKTITFTNIGINASNGKFGTAIGGSVTGTNQSNVSIGSGTVDGQFFNTATSLAGFAKFSDRKYDTAFGGTKN